MPTEAAVSQDRAMEVREKYGIKDDRRCKGLAIGGDRGLMHVSRPLSGSGPERGILPYATGGSVRFAHVTIRLMARLPPGDKAAEGTWILKGNHSLFLSPRNVTKTPNAKCTQSTLMARAGLGNQVRTKRVSGSYRGVSFSVSIPPDQP